MNRKRTITIILSTICIVVILYFAICTYAVLEVTKTGGLEKALEPTPAEFGVTYEEVTFPARNDQLKIASWFIPNLDSQSAIILVHGRDENRATAMGGTFPQFAAALHKAGFTVLMIDVRGHGLSEEARYDFGLKAKNDVLGAVDWLLEKGYKPGNIGALGISLGGGAVNFAAAEEPAIGVVVGDSTFTDINPVIEKLWQSESGLPNSFLPGVYLMHRIIFGFDLHDAVPIDAVRNMSPRPVLIVHCKLDEAVPVEQAEEMVSVIPGAETWYVDSGCEHAQINTVMPEEYENNIIPFFVEHLP